MEELCWQVRDVHASLLVCDGELCEVLAVEIGQVVPVNCCLHRPPTEPKER